MLEIWETIVVGRAASGRGAIVRRTRKGRDEGAEVATSVGREAMEDSSKGGGDGFLLRELERVREGSSIPNCHQVGLQTNLGKNKLVAYSPDGDRPGIPRYQTSPYMLNSHH